MRLIGTRSLRHSLWKHLPFRASAARWLGCSICLAATIVHSPAARGDIYQWKYPTEGLIYDGANWMHVGPSPFPFPTGTDLAVFASNSDSLVDFPSDAGLGLVEVTGGNVLFRPTTTPAGPITSVSIASLTVGGGSLNSPAAILQFGDNANGVNLYSLHVFAGSLAVNGNSTLVYDNPETLETGDVSVAQNSGLGTYGPFLSHGNITVDNSILEVQTSSFTIDAGKTLTAQNNAKLELLQPHTIDGGNTYTIQSGSQMLMNVILNDPHYVANLVVGSPGNSVATLNIANGLASQDGTAASTTIGSAGPAVMNLSGTSYFISGAGGTTIGPQGIVTVKDNSAFINGGPLLINGGIMNVYNNNGGIYPFLGWSNAPDPVTITNGGSLYLSGTYLPNANTTTVTSGGSLFATTATFGSGSTLIDGSQVQAQVLNLTAGSNVDFQLSGTSAGTQYGQVTAQVATVLNLTAGSNVDFQLSGTSAGTQYGQITAQVATLGGTMTVALTGGFHPTWGNAFNLITFPFGLLTGTFSSINLPALDPGLYWDTVFFNQTGTLLVGNPGDVNRDGVVNGLDISLLGSHWLQTGASVPGDANGDGIVNGLDIAVISANWLAVGVLGGGGSGAAAVPEPSAAILAVLAGLTLLAYRRRR
jgi:hypothetical protein